MRPGPVQRLEELDRMRREWQEEMRKTGMVELINLRRENRQLKADNKALRERSDRITPVAHIFGVPIYDAELAEALKDTHYDEIDKIARENVRLQRLNVELDGLKRSREHLLQQEIKRTGALAEEVTELRHQNAGLDRERERLVDKIKEQQAIIDDMANELRSQGGRIEDMQRQITARSMSIDEEVDAMADALVKGDHGGAVKRKLTGFEKTLGVISLVCTTALSGTIYEMTSSVLATVIAAVVIFIIQSAWSAHCFGEWRREGRFNNMPRPSYRRPPAPPPPPPGGWPLPPETPPRGDR